MFDPALWPPREFPCSGCGRYVTVREIMAWVIEHKSEARCPYCLTIVGRAYLAYATERAVELERSGRGDKRIVAGVTEMLRRADGPPVVTECCGRTILQTERFCSKCGHEARAVNPELHEAEDPDLIRLGSDFQ